MFKKDKTQKTSKGRWKWVFAVLAILILVAAGVVLGITYWPANSSELKNVIYSKSIETDEEETRIYEFITSHMDELTQAEQLTYVNEVSSYEYIVTAVDRAFEFYNLTLEGVIEGKLARKDIKNIESLLNDNQTNYKKMVEYIEEHEEVITTATIKQAWESLREYYKVILQNYQKVFEQFHQLTSTQTLSGVYGNDMFVLTVKGMGDYLETINEKFFGKENYQDSNLALKLSKNLELFSQYYLVDENNIISNHYLSSYLQTSAENLKLLEEKTDGKVNFTYILKNDYDCDKLSLSIPQLKYVNIASVFLKGGMSL